MQGGAHLFSRQWYIQFVAADEDGAVIEFGKRWLRRIGDASGVSKVPVTTQNVVETATHSLEVAQRWITQCNEEHAVCNLTNFNRFNVPSVVLPSRLIELSEGRGGLRARLRERKNFPKDCRFVSLSHCWGSGPTYCLRSDVFEEFRIDIPIDELPRTFQDTFAVIVRLGYSFVWIGISFTPTWSISSDRIIFSLYYSR
jgi:hypothetical protein